MSVSSISSVTSISSVSSISTVSEYDISTECDSENEPQRQRLPRVFRDRNNPFEIYNDKKFRSRFRLTKQTVVNVLELIEIHITPMTLRNRSITAMNQLLITLRFYATGSFQIVIGDHFNVTKATFCRIIHRLTHYIAILAPRYIRMPEAHNRNSICRDFYDIIGFPNVCGAIDCSHVKIQSPGENNAEVFRNRKGFFSINVQAVCDAKLHIMDVVARWPGSTHDSRIFDNSLLRAKFENNEFGSCYLLGDSGYPCRRYLLTPLLNPTTPAENRYINAHIRTRNTIERTFGVFKRRFPCLSNGLRINLQKSLGVIVAVCVLHNICIDMNDYDDDEFFDVALDADNELVNRYIQGENYAVRTSVINEIFT